MAGGDREDCVLQGFSRPQADQALAFLLTQGSQDLLEQHLAITAQVCCMVPVVGLSALLDDAEIIVVSYTWDFNLVRDNDNTW